MIAAEDLPTDALAKVDEALARGAKIKAIGIVREASGLGLKEARIFVEAHGKPVARKGDPIRRG